MNLVESATSAVEELESILAKTHDLKSRQQIVDMLAAYRAVLAEHESEVRYD